MKFDLQNPVAKKIAIVSAIVLTLTGGIVLVTNLSANKPIRNTIDPGYSEYISAYTAGVISISSPVRFQLAREVADSADIGQEVDEEVVQLSPSVDGTAYWLDRRTLEFRPAERLESGTTYQVDFQLAKLMDVPKSFKKVSYEIKTIPQQVEVSIIGLEPADMTDPKKQQLKGEILTADWADPQKVETLLKAEQDGNALNVEWEHQPDLNTYHFTVKNIVRKENSDQVEVSVNGSPLRVDYDLDMPVEVPAIGDFKLIGSQVVQSPTQYVSLRFSDPLDPKQNLEGLVTVQGVAQLDYQVSGNEIMVFPPIRQTGDKKVVISPGIKNVTGHKMAKSQSVELSFKPLGPQVNFVGKGSILPGTNRWLLPFEAVNLTAVDVKIIQIYEENIAQFLQINALSGNSELKRVGRPIALKKINLNPREGETGRWGRYSIDLSELVKAEPGAIYQVSINFKKSYAIFECEDPNAAPSEPQAFSEEDADDPNLTQLEEKWDANTWDYWDEYYYDYYDWENRDNPCSDSYYGGRRQISKNVLASDLGLIAKRGSNGDLVVAATDLTNANPLTGVEINVYNYQNQVLATNVTNGEGLTTLNTKQVPFLIVAKYGQQRGYLKINDGGSLSLSSFDVSGQQIQKGLKGFLYGERGIWRPGDTLHLTFILEDKLKSLPESHPMIFEMTNSRGQMAYRTVQTNSVGGMYRFSTPTGSDAPTGIWTAKVMVGGTEFTKTFPVETVKPNRLKISLDFGKKQFSASDKQVKGQLAVRWLHGAPAPNLRAQFEMDLTKSSTTFANYTNFVFDDPSQHFYGESEMIFDNRLDAAGQSVISANLPVEEGMPGKLNVTFKGRVYEEGGNFSIDQVTVPYFPYPTYTGIRLPDTDTWGYLASGSTHQANLVALTPEGQPTSTAAEIEIYKMEWRWWWAGEDDEMVHYSRGNQELIVRENIRIENGKANWGFKISEGGRYMIRSCNESGHCASQVFYVSWGEGENTLPEAATMLSFSSDKKEYQVGEEVKLTIPGNEQAKALVSLENGSRIIRTFWVPLQKGETVTSFKVTPDMAPTVYAHVSLIQPHSQVENDLPMRLYGILSLPVNDPETRLTPVIKVPSEWAPEQKVTVKVSEDNGKPMSYTLAIVDEGLLALTRYQAPDPHETFYAREALGVRTWDLYDEVMGAFSGKFGRILAIGGDGLDAAKKNAKTNRFPPMVKFMGPFQLDKGKTNNHTFTLPQYIGEVRVMVVAAQNGAYGKAEQSVPVRKPLMVAATLPRVLGPGESLSLPVSVFAMDNSVKNVQVEVKANSIIQFPSGNTRQVSFSATGEQTIQFPITVKNATGMGKIEVIATSGQEKASYLIELDVRNPNPPTTRVLEAVIEPGKSWSESFAAVGIAGTNSAVLEVSSIPAMNLENRLQYLLAYPYGCVEQTVSSVFPQLFVSNLIELSEQEKRKIENNVKAGIQRLMNFQSADGGLAYWPGEGASDEWGSNYAHHFLLEAEAKGYNVPPSLLANLKKYQLRKARDWRRDYRQPNSELVQAYRLYTLALAKTPDNGAMNRLRESSGLLLQAKWRLAAAYFLSGKAEAGKALVAQATTTVEKYSELSYTYGSAVRDEAMILETISLMDDKKAGFDLVKKLATGLGSNSWYSTQETAYSLLAISKFTGNAMDKKGLSYNFAFNGAAPKEATSQLFVAQQTVPIKDQMSVSLTNKGSGVLFARVLLRGTPARGNEVAQANNLRLTVSYEDRNGEPIDPAKIVQGNDFFAVVKVFNPGTRGNYQEMALTQIFPSGWEVIESASGALYGQGEANAAIDYKDVRDDRVNIFFDIRANQEIIFKTRLNSTYPGTYYLPAVTCEAMYDNSISAQTTGKEVQVVGLTEQ